MKIRHQWVYYIVLSIIALLAYGYVCNQLLAFNNWDHIYHRLSDQPLQFLLIVLLQLFLLGINLGLEGAKWHSLISVVHRQTYRISLWQVLGGVTAAAATPGRLGEPVGRLWKIPNGKRTLAITLSLTGSLMQNGVITVAGFCGLAFLLFASDLNVDIPHIQAYTWYFFISGILLITACALIMRYSSRFQWLMSRWKISRMILIFRKLRWIRPLLFTILRFFCFSLQYALWLNFFHIELSVDVMIAFVFIYFLIITIIPSFVLADLGIRGSVAVFLFGQMCNQTGGIILATFMLWFLNVALPALIGGIFFVLGRRR